MVKLCHLVRGTKREREGKGEKKKGRKTDVHVDVAGLVQHVGQKHESLV